MRAARRNPEIGPETRPGAARPGHRAGPRRVLAALKLYWILASASVRAAMQYKFDFVTSSIIQAVTGAIDYYFVAVILWKFKTIAGWDIYEVGLLFAVSKIGIGIYRVFSEELEQFERYMVTGDFDSVLVRPWPSLLVVLSRRVDLSRLSLALQGMGVAAVCVPQLLRSGKLTWGDIGFLALACACSAVLFFVVGLAAASAAFWITRIDELQVFTQNAPATATLHPLEIYPGWLRVVLLTALPFGVGNYVPVRYLLGKGGTWMNLVWPLIACAVGLTVSLKLWHAGEAAYQSTGS